MRINLKPYTYRIASFGVFFFYFCYLNLNSGYNIARIEEKLHLQNRRKLLS